MPGPFQDRSLYDDSLAIDDRDDAPKNLDAERCVLGAMLWDNSVINDVVMCVDADDFFREVHQVVFQSISDLYNSGSSVDCVLLAEDLGRRGLFAKIGGDRTLEEIAGSVAHGARAVEHASVVHQKAITRRLIQISTQTIEECQSKRYTANQLVDSAERKIFSVAEKRVSSSTIETEKIVSDVLENIRKAKKDREVFGISTGFEMIDERLGGMKPGQLIILAARPGVGKTAMALNIAGNRSKAQDSTLFVSLEMEAIELGYRLFSARAGVDSRRIISVEPFTDIEERSIKQAAAEIEESRLRVDDAPGQSLLKIAANARRWKQRDNLSFLVIDYLGLINETATRNQNTVDVLTKISNGLKNLAKELKIPILALHQLNRASENEVRPPRKSDLRGSGSIEQDADIIMLLHTEMKDDDVAGKVDVIIAKNRSGPTGVVPLWFNKPCNRFESMAPPGQAQAAQEERPDPPLEDFDSFESRPF